MEDDCQIKLFGEVVSSEMVGTILRYSGLVAVRNFTAPNISSIICFEKMKIEHYAKPLVLISLMAARMKGFS